MCRDPESSEPTWAHCGKLFSDSPTAPSDRWPTSASWTCHEGLPLSFWRGGGHFPDTRQVGDETMKKEKKKKKRQKKKNQKKIRSKMTKVHNRGHERQQTKGMDLY